LQSATCPYKNAVFLGEEEDDIMRRRPAKTAVAAAARDWTAAIQQQHLARMGALGPARRAIILALVASYARGAGADEPNSPARAALGRVSPRRRRESG